MGPNGEIIVDEESTFIETTAAKKAKEDLLKTPLVFENAGGSSNYGTWGKKRRVVDWKRKETLRFYKVASGHVFIDSCLMQDWLATGLGYPFGRENRSDALFSNELKK